MVEGCYLRFIQSFHDCDNCCIHEADVRVSIAVAKLSHAPIVLGSEVLNSVRPGLDISEEGDQHARLKPHVNPVVHFYKHGSGNNQRFTRGFEQPP